MFTVIREGNVILEKFSLYYNDTLIEYSNDIERIAYMISGNLTYDS